MTKNLRKFCMTYSHKKIESHETKLPFKMINILIFMPMSICGQKQPNN